MKTNSTFSPDESAQEIALRATLHEHVPVDVNVDRAWFIVSQRLSTNAQPSTRSTLRTPLSWFPGKRNRIVSLKGRLIVGAVVLVAILVAGINLLFPLMPGTSSVADAKQFQPIGISQSLNGITITADKGYASDAGIGIEYQVQLPATLMKNLVIVLPTPSYIIKGQNGQSVQLHDLITSCNKLEGLLVRCYSLMTASHLNVASNNRAIIWEVTGIKLMYQNPAFVDKKTGKLIIRGTSRQALMTTKVLKGLWQFHIILNYHSGNYIPEPTGW